MACFVTFITIFTAFVPNRQVENGREVEKNKQPREESKTGMGLI